MDLPILAINDGQESTITYLNQLISSELEKRRLNEGNAKQIGLDPSQLLTSSFHPDHYYPAMGQMLSPSLSFIPPSLSPFIQQPTSSLTT
ncbi:hypothetical protein PMAYCL1PPCAC_28389, partial [Pristionchus mayeri]